MQSLLLRKQALGWSQAKSSLDSCQPTVTIMVHDCHPSQAGSVNRRISSRPARAKTYDSIPKISKGKELQAWLKWYRRCLASFFFWTLSSKIQYFQNKKSVHETYTMIFHILVYKTKINLFKIMEINQTRINNRKIIGKYSNSYKVTNILWQIGENFKIHWAERNWKWQISMFVEIA